MVQLMIRWEACVMWTYIVGFCITSAVVATALYARSRAGRHYGNIYWPSLGLCLWLWPVFIWIALWQAVRDS